MCPSFGRGSGRPYFGIRFFLVVVVSIHSPSINTIQKLDLVLRVVNSGRFAHHFEQSFNKSLLQIDSVRIILKVIVFDHLFQMLKFRVIID